jgi:hypothetical protein
VQSFIAYVYRSDFHPELLHYRRSIQASRPLELLLSLWQPASRLFSAESEFD